MMYLNEDKLNGERYEIVQDDDRYPEALRNIPSPPECLRVIGDPAALQEGLAIVGARKATPYGLSSATHFAKLAAERGVAIISGGARGCDTASHLGALERGGKTVAFLGGGCDVMYPPENRDLFQQIVDSGGAVVSEQDWSFRPLRYTFRERNRLIAGLAKATLIVEASLPSGTFSTADAALAAGKEVLAVPGAISSQASLGANRLIYQGATPVVDDDTFYDQLFSIFGCLIGEDMSSGDEVRTSAYSKAEKEFLEALQAKPMGIDELYAMGAEKESGSKAMSDIMMLVAKAERDGLIAQYPDGRYGPILRC